MVGEGKKRSTIRTSFDAYGISKERYRELRDYCMDPANAGVVEREAGMVSEVLKRYITASVTRNLSYEKIEYLDGHRIPCGKSDFYGYRRMFYNRINALPTGQKLDGFERF